MFESRKQLKHLSDWELVEGYRKRGENRFLEELFVRHRRVMLGVAYRITGDFALSEDVVQEALLRAQQHLGSFENSEPGSGFRRWILRICKNLAIDGVRKATRRVTTPDGFEPQIAAERSGLSEGEQLLNEVLEFLRDLDDPYRLCFLYFAVEGYSYDEIVAKTGLSFDQVKAFIRTARRRIRKEFA